MAKFMLVFRGGAVVNKGLSLEERKAQVGKWGAWMDALKASNNYIAGGAPLSSEGAVLRTAQREQSVGFPVDSDLVTGTLIFLEAPSLADAAALAKGCPILDLNGSVEIRPVMERPQ